MGKLFGTAGIIWLALVVGWIINVVKAVNGVLSVPHLGDIATLTIVRIVGAFLAPLGSLLGLFYW